MDVVPLGLDGVFEITPRRFEDERGFFSETWSRPKLADAGIDLDFVQDNHSLSRQAGVLRGLHFQRPPFAQDKLLRVVAGRVFDVVVDIRAGSPTLGRWVARELSAQAGNQILVPKGFAHGFLTLEPDTEVIYKVSAPYDAASDAAIAWDDPDIGIEWPLGELGDGAPILSTKDRAAPPLSRVETGFTMEAERT